MASSSPSSIQKSFKYDVFLSFRGEDTRKNFVDHLYYALQQKSINTYKDDEKINKGKRINDELISSIEDSKFYIIVFSKNYASSSWCLDELVKIMECQKAIEHTAYPVFYDVEPTEVRKQIGAVGEAFAKHKEEVAGKWREALREAAELAGWELKNTLDGHEAKFIQKIVKEISQELRFINSSVDEKLVGMETRVKDVVSSLETGFDDVCMIGIKGMGGSGKTTLARAVFDQISIWFEGKSFVENVREVSKDSMSGLKKLQKQVLLDVLNDQSIRVTSVYSGKNIMKKMLRSRKVLIVLDDVDNIDQLEALAGEPNWFKSGSKIIITTRDEQVLAAHRVNFIHDVNMLSNEEALCLFSRYAFGREIPIRGYEELSRKVVHYAAGLPLTIRVLGSFLCSKTEREWVDALERLNTIPLKQTLEKLELSYNGLDNDYKEIFLDVACILKGESKDEAIRVLESCGFHAQIGLRVLEQNSLVTISDNDSLCLHDHIEEMGMNIVRRLHPTEPNKHSRLWIDKEIKDILVKDLGTQATRCIKLRHGDLHPTIIMKGLRNMKELRYLYVNNRSFCLRKGHDDILSGGWKFNEVSRYLPNALRFLHWHYYPFRCLPKTFEANNLVSLEMCFSNISQLWEGGESKVIKHLKFLNLSSSKLRTFNLGLTPHLERLNLAGCNDFVELRMPVKCPKLKILDLRWSKLSELNLGLTPHLERLDLAGCNNFVGLHMLAECPKLKSLNVTYSKLRTFDLGLTPHLESLHLGGCNDFVELHMPIECMKLKVLDLRWCKLSNLNLRLTPHLERLDLRGCNDFVGLHMDVEFLNLKSLDARWSKLRNLNLGLTPHLERLDLGGCSEFVELHMPFECPKLKILDLRWSKLSKLNLEMTPHLERLYLGACNDFVELRMPVQCLNLRILNLSYLKLKIFDLGLTPHLERLDLRGCNDLAELHMPVECAKLKILDLRWSKLRTLNLRLTPHIERLDLGGCNDFVELHMPVECTKLRFLNLSYLKLRTIDLCLTPHLEILDLQGCNDFVELHMPVECPKLKILDLRWSKLSNLNLRLTPHLERLNLGGCNHFVELYMPVECPQLRFLNLSYSKLRTLDLGRTPNLERLDLRGCNDFVELHMHVECLKLQSLYLRWCKLKNFNLGLTPHLERLDLGGCNDFVELKMPVECPSKLRFLNLSYSMLRTFDLGLTPHLEKLDLGGCNEFVELLMPVECPKLKFLNLSGSKLTKLELIAESLDICPLYSYNTFSKFQFKCFYDEPLPSSSGNLEKLISFGLCAGTNLESFSTSIGGLQRLGKFTLEGSFPDFPEDLYQLESLEELTLLMKEIKHLPENICMLNHLKSLELKSCLLLEKLPDDLGRLECLEKLILTECMHLQHIPNSICKMKSLKNNHCNSQELNHTILATHMRYVQLPEIVIFGGQSRINRTWGQGLKYKGGKLKGLYLIKCEARGLDGNFAKVVIDYLQNKFHFTLIPTTLGLNIGGVGAKSQPSPLSSCTPPVLTIGKPS
ncbi:hypothetical protein L1987_02440 [Smallanthus sonchifolius]|uniref:Uncharacterized protein n=1 Tax=Smallanthus sonchifolius TaxID=185202 RepID=A0ACB9K808_9ASTR|nr:hypothetical protein L1987_02440 [Smallanthus sonchifolius]